MSVIHEALKKAARERTSSQISRGDYRQGLPRKGGSLRPGARALAAAAILAVFGGIVLWSVVPRAPAPGPSTPAVAPPPSPATPLPAAEPPPALPVLPRAEPAGADTDNPEEARRLNSVAVGAFRRGDFEEAKRLLQDATVLLPEYAEAYNNLGMVHRAEERHGEARKAYRQALRHRPDYPEALNNLGVLLQGEGRTEEARDYFQRAVRARQGYSAAHLNLAVSYDRDGLQAEAFYHYKLFLDSATAGDAEAVRRVRRRLGL